MYNTLDKKCALVTGAARRIGAATATVLHDAGASVIIHCRDSLQDGEALAAQMNERRDDSARVLQADLKTPDACNTLIENALGCFGRLDLLVNNASTFYATPLGTITETHWDDLVGTNLKAPLFLSQAAYPALKERNGSIVNIVDIHAQRPLKDHPVYGPAKAGLAMLTRSLAKDLAPEVRVNGVAPGAILWPENDMDNSVQENIIGKIPLRRPGDPRDVAKTVLFLATDAGYITGQIIAVDGGRSLGW